MLVVQCKIYTIHFQWAKISDVFYVSLWFHKIVDEFWDSYIFLVVVIQV